MKSIGELLREDRIKWKGKPYIWVMKNGKYESYSFDRVVEDVWKTANALNRLGLHGKNLMIFAPNSYEWMVLGLSIMGYVGTCVPVDKDWTEYDLSHVKSSIPIDAVFCEKESMDLVKSAGFDDCPVFNLKELASLNGSKTHASEPEFVNTMSETSQILFSSGTTNLPKAIPLTQDNMFANATILYQRTPITEKDRSFLFLPLNHVYGSVTNLLYSTLTGMEIYLCSDPSRILQEFMLVRPTAVCMVPMLLSKLYEKQIELEKLGNNSILDVMKACRFIYSGGSALDPRVKMYFTERGVKLIESYGMSENSSVVALESVDDPIKDSCGFIFENVSVKILNPDWDGYGEILTKGACTTIGYLNVKDQESYFDEDGYFRTGDIGKVDEEGRLYLKGRKRRLILTGNGKNVYPDELEKLLLTFKKVQKAKVYEENHHIHAEVYADCNEEEISAVLAAVNSKLPKYKQIKEIHLKNDVSGIRVK